MADLNAIGTLGTTGEVTPPPGVHFANDDQKSLYKATLEFERFFLQHMMKSMNDATAALSAGSKGDQPGMAGMGTYKDMASDQMVQSMLDGGGIGLASVLYGQMVKQLPGGGTAAVASGTGAAPASTPGGTAAAGGAA